MFEKVFLQSCHNKKILKDPNALALCHFGPLQSISLVAITQTQDKLLVFDLSPDGHLIDLTEDDSITVISVNDVVFSLSSSLLGQHGHSSKDYLFIGCSGSIMVYDCMAQAHLFRISTTNRICTIMSNYRYDFRRDLPSTRSTNGSAHEPIICGGVQRIYALTLDTGYRNLEEKFGFGAEVTSEKGISETITCIVKGKFRDTDFILTGSNEKRIRIYKWDSFDYNIQTCELTVNESAQINCLCGILTEIPRESSSRKHGNQSDQLESRPLDTEGNDRWSMGESMLPSISSDQMKLGALAANNQVEQMSHFAFGLANGLVGVYRFYTANPNSDEISSVNTKSTESKASLNVEHLWRHKSKHVPVSMVMLDINGDGYEELVIGYRSGRIEARSPLTGQLLGAKRCFRSDNLIGLAISFPYPGTETSKSLQGMSNSDNLFGLKSQDKLQASRDQADTNQADQTLDAMLILCSSNANLVSFKFSQSSQRKSLPCFDKETSYAKSIGDKWADLMLGKQVKSRDITEAELESINLTTINEFEEEGAKQSKRDSSDEDAVTGGELSPKRSNDPIRSQARQNADLLQRISRLEKEQMELEQTACNVHHYAMQRVAALNNYALSDLIEGVSVAHRFSLCYGSCDSGCRIKLSILVGCSTNELVDSIELSDPEETFDEKIRILLPVNSRTKLEVTNQVYLFETEYHNSPIIERSVNMTAKIYCSSKESRLRSKFTNYHSIAHVHFRTINVPRFCALLPKISYPETINFDSARLIAMKFPLDDTEVFQIVKGNQSKFQEVI